MDIPTNLPTIQDMIEEFLECFPRISIDNTVITSSDNPIYNCIAWAAIGDPSWQTFPANWWWPISNGNYTVWPEGCPQSLEIESFCKMFEIIGFTSSEDGSFEAGLEKIAIYIDKDNKPTHAARQLSDGKWTSKLGQSFDIVHDTPHVLTGPTYGDPVIYMQRPRQIPRPPLCVPMC